MRSVELVARRTIRFDPAAAVPAPGPDEVLVRVRACTVCNRSDLTYFHYLGLREHCAGGCFGHEIAGEVAGLGDRVDQVRLGQRVFVRTPLTSGYADFALAREIAVGACPERVPFQQAAILQLLPLAVHATRGVRLGDSVLVVGQGPVGLMALQVLRLRGASRITVCDLDEWRLRRSDRFGADEAARVSGDPTSLAELGGGFDVAIDAVGTPVTVNACVDLVRPNGLVVLLGTHHIDTQVSFDLVKWERKSLRVHSSTEPDDAARVAVMRTAERLISSRPDAFHLDEMLTHEYPLTRLEDAIELLSASSVLYPAAEPAPVAGPPPRTLKVAVCP
jgi:threonine dehydrogenase-like Zn-dependent dehydrogenase